VDSRRNVKHVPVYSVNEGYRFVPPLTPSQRGGNTFFFNLTLSERLKFCRPPPHAHLSFDKLNLSDIKRTAIYNSISFSLSIN
jgi:hypothetical protein